MKHVFPFLFAGLLVLTVLPASAQLHAFGVKAGVSSATQGGGFAELYKDLDGDVGRRTGAVVGGFVQLAAGNLPFLIQPELLYTMKGVTLGGDGLVERELNVNYLDIPVLARFDFDAGSVSPFVTAGPVLSILVGSSAEREGVEFDVGDELKSSDVALSVGGGVAFGAVDVELRYAHGLSNITTSDDEDEGAKNRWIGVAVGYTLGGQGQAAQRNR